MKRPPESSIADDWINHLPIVPSSVSRAAAQRRALEAATGILRDLTHEGVEPVFACSANDPTIDHGVSSACPRSLSQEGLTMWF